MGLRDQTGGENFGMWDISPEGKRVVRDHPGMFLQISGTLLSNWGAERCPVKVLVHFQLTAHTLDLIF